MNPLAPAVAAALALSASALATPPAYQIIDLGRAVPTDTSAAQGFGVSDNGIAVGRSVGSNTAHAMMWSLSDGTMGLPNLATRAYAVGNDANNSGVVVGTAASTLSGSSPLPVMWQNGVVSQLPLPAGNTLGRAFGVNNAGMAVGSVGAGVTEFGVIYNGGVGTIITQTTSNGSFVRTAYAVNDAGRIVGVGVDPNNAAVNVGYVLDTATNTAFAVPPLPGNNGTIAFGLSPAGHVVGSSMLNQGAGMPFIWHDSTGSIAIPLPAGTSQGSARDANSDGWAVGTASGLFAVPFLFDGMQTYALQDLLPANSDWDLAMNTFSSALGISDDGIIVGTGLHNGQISAYALVPVPAPSGVSLFALAAVPLARRRRRR